MVLVKIKLIWRAVHTQGEYLFQGGKEWWNIRGVLPSDQEQKYFEVGKGLAVNMLCDINLWGQSSANGVQKRKSLWEIDPSSVLHPDVVCTVELVWESKYWGQIEQGFWKVLRLGWAVHFKPV